MTNRIAAALAFVLAAAVGLDLALDDGRALLFLGRRLLDLIDWVAFWR